MPHARPGTSDDVLALLRKAELFSSLLDDDLSYVAERCEVAAFPAGSVLFAPGEKARRFFIVRSGTISVYRGDDAGLEREMARYVEGDVLGDFDFALGSSLDAKARAESDCSVVVFPAGGLCMEDLAREKPDATARILLRSLSMISSRLRSTQRLISENAPWVRELRKQVYTDPGTGLWSRTFLDEEVPRSLAGSTAIVLLKPDRFKELNDALGHAAGDAAMTRVAALLSEEVERLGRGWALRLRSNETAIVAPSCDAREAKTVARRLAAAVSAMSIRLGETEETPGFAFTASVAYAVWPEDGADWRRLVDAAYGLLTRAWRDGGNRIYHLKARDRGDGA